MKNNVLAIDCGTQSLRALLFNASGQLLETVKIEYDPYSSPFPGWAEQDPDIFWQSLISACQRMKEKNAKLFGSICGIGITTQRATMINVDEKGLPLRPSITWLDQRKAEDRLPLKSLLYPVLKVGGLDKVLSRLYRDGKCNWIRQNQPDLWKKTHKYLQVSGFLNHRLTGEFRDSAASQIGHLPFNYTSRTWSGALEPASILVPIERE